MSGADARGDLGLALGGMSRGHQIAFGAACCERLLPNYRRFWVDEKWGNPKNLRDALDTVWRAATGGSVSPAEASGLLEALGSVTPTPGSAFSSRYTSAALDASVAVQEMVEMCVDGDVRHAVEAGALAREGIFMYLDAKNTDNFSASGYEDYSEHPLMRREVDRQKGDLETLRQHKALSAGLIDGLRSIELSTLPE